MYEHYLEHPHNGRPKLDIPLLNKAALWLTQAKYVHTDQEGMVDPN